MGDGQHPAAVVAAGIVKDVELAGGQALDSGLVLQGAQHRISERLAFVHEGAGQRPRPVRWVPARRIRSRCNASDPSGTVSTAVSTATEGRGYSASVLPAASA